jgi:hypothetical protein
MSRSTFIECDRLEPKVPEKNGIEFLKQGVSHPNVRECISLFRTAYNSLAI